MFACPTTPWIRHWRAWTVCRKTPCPRCSATSWRIAPRSLNLKTERSRDLGEKLESKHLLTAFSTPASWRWKSGLVANCTFLNRSNLNNSHLNTESSLVKSSLGINQPEPGITLMDRRLVCGAEAERIVSIGTATPGGESNQILIRRPYEKANSQEIHSVEFSVNAHSSNRF